MMKLLYIIWAAVIMLCPACSSDVQDYEIPENNDLLGAAVTIGVSACDADSTRVNSSSLTDMSWEKGDVLIAVGYDDAGAVIMNNDEVQTSVFSLKSDEEIGKKMALFVGHTIKGAVKYKFMYNGINAAYNAHNDRIEIDYLNQHVTTNNSSDMKNSLVLVAEDVTSLQSDVILKPRNSILKLNVREIPSSQKITAVMWAVESDNGAKNVMAYATVPAINSGDVLYLAFDPSHNLKKEGSISFEFFTDMNKSYRVSDVSAQGKIYDYGKIYTASVGGSDKLNRFTTPMITSAQMLVRYEGDGADVLKGFDNNGLNAAGYFVYTKQDGVITEIDSDVFRGKSMVKEIILPDFVKTISDNAFEGCSSLVRADVREGVQTIGSMAFGGCASLKDIILPSSLTAVGKMIFKGCVMLRDISIKTPAAQLGASYADLVTMFDSASDRSGCCLHLHNTWKDAVYNGHACVNDRLFMNGIMFKMIDYTLPVNGNDGLDAGGELPDMPFN